MDRLMHLVVGVFRRAVAVARGRRWSRTRQEELYGSTSEREELMETVRRNGGTRTRSVHVIGPLASSDGIGSDEEEINYMEGQSVKTSVKYREVRRCDCGAVLRHDNWLLGICSLCARVVCSQEGCGVRCERCGALICTRHSVRFGDHCFCSRHRWYALWLLFWGMLK